ncbi:hypothetical protein [Aminipila sp.]|uniref:hypothetical protein n=1 Tax=Aminipila sp. TaxID=2060095 RepID=UPI0028A069C1|nr:hypothetical protein [Aminipila sp.]
MESVKEKLSNRLNQIDGETGEILTQESCSNKGMAFSLSEVEERLNMLQKFISKIMVEGTDYGVLPNTDKRCLFKSGAEKLCDVFGLSKRIEIISRVEDFDKGIFHYEAKAIVTDKKTGIIEAEGVGSCNSREKKYRTQDAYNIANTVLKMAKKRALVDAVLSATRSSDIFTQDIEDDDFKLAKKEKNQISADKGTKQRKNDTESASKKQISYIFTILSNFRIPVESARSDMERLYGISESKDLTKQQASEFIEHLKNYRKAG